MSLTPRERSLRGRIGALTLHATHDPRETTKNARAAFLASFEDQVDPEHVLAPEERQRRAAVARKLHFARLALASAQARRPRRRPAKKPSPASAGQAAQPDACCPFCEAIGEELTPKAQDEFERQCADEAGGLVR